MRRGLIIIVFALTTVLAAGCGGGGDGDVKAFNAALDQIFPEKLTDADYDRWLQNGKNNCAVDDSTLAARYTGAGDNVELSEIGIGTIEASVEHLCPERQAILDDPAKALEGFDY